MGVVLGVRGCTGRRTPFPRDAATPRGQDDGDGSGPCLDRADRERGCRRAGCRTGPAGDGRGGQSIAFGFWPCATRQPFATSAPAPGDWNRGRGRAPASARAVPVCACLDDACGEPEQGRARWDRDGHRDARARQPGRRDPAVERRPHLPVHRRRERRGVAEHDGAPGHRAGRSRRQDLLEERVPCADGTSRGVRCRGRVAHGGRQHIAWRHAHRRVYAETELESNRGGNSDLGLDPSPDLNSELGSTTDTESNPNSESLSWEFQRGRTDASKPNRDPRWNCELHRFQLHTEQLGEPQLLRAAVRRSTHQDVVGEGHMCRWVHDQRDDERRPATSPSPVSRRRSISSFRRLRPRPGPPAFPAGA